MKKQSALSIAPIRLASPRCTVGISDGSERGSYVPQAHLLNQMGRPHHTINLMFQYYPDMENWPTQGVNYLGFYRNTQLNKGDGYFPLVLEENGPWGQQYLRQIEDVRAHGQEPQLTLTLHADTPDSVLKQIALSLVPYGRMRIRINHECNGVWFYFNQRWSYKEVSDFFIRFHNILHEYAPEVSTCACWNGPGEDYNKPDGAQCMRGQLTDDSLGPMFRAADIVSFDQYASLHWGWPNPAFDPKKPTEYFGLPFEIWWKLLDDCHNKMCDLRGEEVNIEVHEINEDANVIGAQAQAEWVTRFYNEAARLNLPWLTNITYYMFRDRGGLGLEKEDVNKPDVYSEQPALATYREAIRHANFEFRTEPLPAPAPSPLSFKWVTPVQAEGIQFSYAIPQGTPNATLAFPADRNLLVGCDRQWTIKPVGQTYVKLPCQPGEETLAVKVFAPPADGKNNTAGAFVTQLAEPPEFV
ncbi:MAG TPA: hypothetical protein DCZ95_16470 [Verrucomicrobia bacterium]|nr:MAG: hypothetical protein A2X46_15690 [Lentisphaerae bacterium GWF2_57_35]HBA85677.1 hypothetical protein [Verrucomicrobiota bacterium]